MGRFVKGDVVVVPFPFSDLTSAKRRPALVVANLTGDDVILCQITSQATTDKDAIPLTQREFSSGSLHRDSHIRPNRLFTADSNIILYRAGAVHTATMQTVIAVIIRIISSS